MRRALLSGPEDGAIRTTDNELVDDVAGDSGRWSRLLSRPVSTCRITVRYGARVDLGHGESSPRALSSYGSRIYGNH